ncbi:hypothetical protein L226DRAFT_617604 [Lentinus tigrinus ALCF2SS1-7]|uniref:Uncharacterized protein n=1 Tax=Lentinus tigrinus ALCF2SS1-6 TaxID=1328759 RepID=A0A5C2RPM8_9APHY|nr:hypothetical protein L227DRAFT_581669 [Lentinus tigrinus ALCF2SS1-6]RPD68281.1 hypothetical protein L226DRAFT_617604 [Lentinus tigrinus ALCF2SS1-7]
MLLTELAVVMLAVIGLTITMLKQAWNKLSDKRSWVSLVPRFLRADVDESPLPPFASGTRPDTSYPIFDKTPGDDPFVRDDFIFALVKLAKQHLDPVQSQEYHRRLLGLVADDEAVALGCAMIPQHERHRPARTPEPSVSSLWSHVPSHTSPGPQVPLGSQAGATFSFGMPPGSQPNPPMRSTSSRRPSRPLSRQHAFRGAWNADTFFNPVWWLNPRDDSASTSGPALEQWMHSVRIIKRDYARASYGATNTQGEDDVAASWRASFRLAFPAFDILRPGEDPTQSTRWPGFHA